MSVDLPDPDAPIRATISPEAISTETSSNARFPPMKVLDRPRTTIALMKGSWNSE
jgi:hypothetical protein